MMMSPARIAANAANAQFSTGPRTPEGKARSARNSLKHGLTARELIVRDDEREEFEQLEASLIEEIRPQGALEQTTFAQLLHAAWNLRRVRRLEAELFSNGADPLLDPERAPTSDRLARYQARMERSYYRALRELRTLQTNRALRDTMDSQEAETVPVLASNKEVIKRTQHDPVNNLVRYLDLEPKLLLANARFQHSPSKTADSTLSAGV